MYFRRPQCSQRADFPEKPTAGTVVDDLKNCRRCISRAHQAPPPSQSAKGQCTSRGDICPCCHCRRQCRFFTCGVNSSRNNPIYNIDESTKYILSGLHKLWYPSIRDTSKWSKFGAHGEHGDVFLFSNLGALWFSENLIRYSLHICLREVKNNLFSFKHS